MFLDRMIHYHVSCISSSPLLEPPPATQNTKSCWFSCFIITHHLASLPLSLIQIYFSLLILLLNY